MTKELIESQRRIMVPFIAKKLKEIDYEGLGESDAKEFTKDFNEILNLAAKALQQESCEDCINRQAALDIYDDYNVAVENGELEAYGKHRKRLLKLPSVQPKQVECEDVISRQAAINAIGDVPDHDDGMVWEALSHAQRDVALLPPVQPKIKTGHWNHHHQYGIYHIECSECSTWFLRSHLVRNSYCPNCGAKMIGK